MKSISISLLGGSCAINTVMNACTNELGWYCEQLESKMVQISWTPL